MRIHYIATEHSLKKQISKESEKWGMLVSADQKKHTASSRTRLWNTQVRWKM